MQTILDIFRENLTFARAVAVSLLVIIFASYLHRWKLSCKYKRLPPGPFSWPVVGYVPFFNIQTIHHKLRMVAEKYGGIFGIYIGGRYVVVIDDFEIMKDAFSREEFTSRPEFMHISPTPGVTSIIDVEGEVWKEMKVFWQRSLRYLISQNDNLLNAVRNEVSSVVTEMENNLFKDVNLKHLLHRSMERISLKLVLGDVLSKSYWKTQMRHHYRALIMFSALNILKYFFGCAAIVTTLIKRRFLKANDVIMHMERQIRKAKEEHEDTLDENNCRDLTDLFLIQMKKPGQDKVFNQSTFTGNLSLSMEFISEPCAHALKWFLLLMAEHPDVQDAIQEEIDSVVGRERKPVLADRQKLLLLEAAILETQRFKNVFHLNFFRRAGKDCKLAGYDIPRDTLIVHNMSSHFRNPKYWSDPERFVPHRFLASDRSSLRIPEQFIAYSYGKRACLGQGVASLVTFVFCATILQRFKILPPKGGLCLDGVADTTNDPAQPFVRVQIRD